MLQQFRTGAICLALGIILSANAESVRFTPSVSGIDQNSYRINLIFQGKSLGVRVMHVRGPSPMTRTYSEYFLMRISGERVSIYDYKREHFAELLLSFGSEQQPLVLPVFAGETLDEVRNVFLEGLSTLCSKAGFKYANDFEFDSGLKELTIMDLLTRPALRDKALNINDRYMVTRTMQSDLLVTMPDREAGEPASALSICLAQDGDRVNGWGCTEKGSVGPNLAFGIRSVTCVR